MAKARDYKHEYQSYQGKPEQIKNRASRNAARAKVKAVKGAAAVAGKDVNHKDGQPRNNDMKNLSIESKSKNRGRK